MRKNSTMEKNFKEKFYSARELSLLLSITSSWIRKRARKEGWIYREESFRGGKILKYSSSSLSPDHQSKLKMADGSGSSSTQIQEADSEPAPILIDQPSFFLTTQENKIRTPERALGSRDLENDQFMKKVKILEEIDSIPPFWKKGRRQWIQAIGLKYGKKSPGTIYRWLQKREAKDLAGLRHTKSSQGKAKSWDPEAKDFWQGLILKREHRGICLKDLYHDIMLIEAQKHGWKIGGYRSGLWWAQKINPILKKYSRGGRWALDNALPPILRDYSDLAPFEILVGDQHKFDRWVIGDETGEVYRQEAYGCMDLRTRIWYGAAIAKKYDSWLIGMALYLGISCYGVFKNFYSDHGKPECSRYLRNILEGMKKFGMVWEQTADFPSEAAEADGEEINPCLILPGDHRFAVVRNAKAKLIERAFRDLEHIMESHFRLSGRTKRLCDDIHWQEIDQEEAESLAKSGKLLTAREHALWMYRAMDYYNRKEPHRGVLREWVWKPKPSEATPWDCLIACCKEGWRKKGISKEAADLIFLAKEERAIQRGRIEFRGNFYEHERLIEIEGRVDVRFNPMDLSEILVFHEGRYLCIAIPVERSSMKDLDLAKRKIIEKRTLAKKFSEEFKKLTHHIPDFRQYSAVPEAERVAALIGKDKKKRSAQQAEFTRQWEKDELERACARMDEKEAKHLQWPGRQRALLPAPVRPEFFRSERERFESCRKAEEAGMELTEDDRLFMDVFESKMRPGERENLQAQREWNLLSIEARRSERERPEKGESDEKRFCS